MTWLRKTSGLHLMGTQSVTSRGILVSQTGVELKTALRSEESHLQCETEDVPTNSTGFYATKMVIFVLNITTVNTKF